MKKFLWFACFCFFSFNLTAQKNIPENADFWSNYPSEDLADFFVDRMTDDELLAQILMFGWAGAEPSELLNQWVSDKGLGSVKVFGWNTDNTELVAKSIASLQKKSQDRKFRIPLFVATDQEGGWIRHVKGDTSDTPGNMAIGASGYPVDAYYSGFYISREIKALGINMNFAPTVDIYTNKDSTVIGPRSFSSNPEHVGELGASFVAGSIAAGVIPTAKHFPGHGDTSLDSHTKLPEINVDRKTLENRELIPFKYLIMENVPAIMSAHLSFPKLLPNGEPASLSKTFLTEILRKELGFKGLIITDDMQMEGAWGYAGNVSTAVRMAIEAGNDIIIFSKTADFRDRLWTANLALMQSNENFKANVKTAARRVILYKLNYFKSGNAAPLYPDMDTLKEKLPDRDGQKFFLSQACRSITAYKSTLLPYIQKEGEKILVTGISGYTDFFREAHIRYKNCTDVRLTSASDWGSSAIASIAKDYDTVIICVSNSWTANVANKLKNSGKKVIIVSILSPVPVIEINWADTILLGYSYSPFTFKAIFSALAGDYIPKGQLPLD